MQNWMLTRCFKTLFSIRCIVRDFHTRETQFTAMDARGYGSRTMVNMSRLSNKVAIVTGASKGIGGGIATALGAAGARVAVNYSSDRKGAERVAQAITDNGGEAIAVGADVSKAADVEQLFKEVDSAFGKLDALVNNAGVFRFGAFAKITEESFHLHSNVNVLGAILTVQVIRAAGGLVVAT